MDSSKQVIMFKKVEKTMANLEKNNIKAFYVANREAVVPQVETLIAEGATVAWGGSKTLYETGVIDYLRAGRYRCLDRDQPDLTPEQIREVFIQTFNADAYLCSSNAISENGELYNVDGNSNRVAAMLFGPKSVIVVAGINKLVKDLDAAVERVRSIAAPVNALRLERNTPCTRTGHCMDCKSPDRICCNYVVMAQQRHLERVKVIIVGEELGY